jgi:hypothetical protein
MIIIALVKIKHTPPLGVVYMPQNCGCLVYEELTARQLLQ